ncbi:hypothetical protein [Hymenobacter cavernae]|uniref:Uncharacterized protein n=1 Tax=Hymenobacter cavernae TaxID=2044852 RepID=A0ABQ1UM66_9BACT|nr:hypothetical protein [Hymenobacter cavernae]GGF19975.1 hypothetical protein GCM10011383_34460 [Hymenobacter cavernae]
MIDPTNKDQTQEQNQDLGQQPTVGGSSSTDPHSDDFAASIGAAQPYDYNTTSENSAERDEEGPPENILKK